jgi:hypothetical protein
MPGFTAFTVVPEPTRRRARPVVQIRVRSFARA